MSAGSESLYYDAEEHCAGDHNEDGELIRPSSPRSESDLDSMSFARDHSGSSISLGSSTEREFHRQPSEALTPGPYRNVNAGGSAVAQLVGESASTPITKTLRFSASAGSEMDKAFAEGGDDSRMMGRLEREEDVGFMCALGFEYEEIARRVQEGAI